MIPKDPFRARNQRTLAVSQQRTRLRLSLAQLIVTILAATSLTDHARADDWPQWLGPNRDGVWREQGIVTEFPEQGPSLRWTYELGGGYSGPAVSNGRVFVMDRIDDVDPGSAELLHDGPAPANENFVRKLIPGKERLVCLRETDGTELWTREWDCPYTSVALYAIGPRATPTVDGDRVYALGAEGDLHCFRVADGEPIWSRDFQDEYGLTIPEWGTAAHPLVDGDKLICVVGGKDSTVVAFDKATGEEIWTAENASQPGYCPPVIHELGGKRQLLVWHSDAVVALNPDTGAKYWSIPVKPTFAMSIGQPVVQGNLVYVMSFNRVSACIEVSADGDSAQVKWEGNAQAGIAGVLNTAVIEDGHIYACGPNGRYGCARLEDGKKLWETFEPSTGDRPAAWANVFTIKHEDRYFMANDLGELIIAKLSPQGYEELSRAQLIEPTHEVSRRVLVWSHPAFANRSVYLRNDKEIRCYDLSKGE